jgi:hypothetical protein
MDTTHLSVTEPGAAAPATKAADVRAELEAILRDPLFGHSRRYPTFLRYVVERTLDGHSGGLKERTVGIEALGRPASYDTSQDPVVRTTAAEVRKRLAQYYQQHPDASVHISLPTGSYVPVFEHPRAGAEPVTPSSPPAADSRRRQYLIAAAAVIAAATTATLLVRANAAAPALQQFWSPVLAANGTVRMAVGHAWAKGAEKPTEFVTMDAASALSKICGLFKQAGTPFEVRSVQLVGFADLRSHPIVAIGGFNNPWTMRITEQLRYRFVREGPSPLSIVDTQTTDGRRWSRHFEDSSSTAGTVLQDVALVTRVRDVASGQWVVALGGIGTHGTAAAGEFLTSAEHTQRFADSAQPGWPDMNVQLVLVTDVHDDVAGPPRVVASHLWR